MAFSPEATANGGILLQNSLSELIQAAKIPAKRRGASIKPAVETLTSACYDRGVLPEVLSELIDLIIAPSHLDQASLNSLIRNLYPATSVDGDIIISIIGCLGYGALKPSLAIQAALLRWLIMIHHVIKEQGTLSKTYAVLFNLLDTAAIRPQLCHLLALITRRRHVRPYRIQAVVVTKFLQQNRLALSRQTGNDPALTGLLRVFKNYYPEIIVGNATRGKASTFKHPDPQWRERLDEIQQAHARSLRDQNQPRDAFRVARDIGNSRGFGGASIIPELHTSHAQEDSFTLEEVENVDGLVNNLEKIELPNQLVSVLADPLLQKLMLLKPDSTAEERVNNWLASYGDEVLRGEATSLAELASFLEILREYVSTTKNIPSAILSFFESYLKIWDGKIARQSILSIVSYADLPKGSFSGLYAQIFAPLEAKVLDGSAESQLDLLKCYTALFRNWGIILHSSSSSAQGPNATVRVAVSELNIHVNKLCLTVLQTSSSASAHSLILDFYEVSAYVAANKKTNRLIRIVIPPPTLVYILHFSPSPVTVSRLCGLLSLYKEGFQLAMSRSRTAYSTEYINEFNGFLMDICNCLWRSRAFNAKDANSHACLMPEDVTRALATYVSELDRGSSLASLFTLSASPTLGLLATSFLRELEDVEMEQGSSGLDTRHAGPVSKASLTALGRSGGLSMTWDEYRQGVLNHLEEQGMMGVGQLMYGTMTTLMKKT